MEHWKEYGQEMHIIIYVLMKLLFKKPSLMGSKQPCVFSKNQKKKTQTNGLTVHLSAVKSIKWASGMHYQINSILLAYQ